MTRYDDWLTGYGAPGLTGEPTCAACSARLPEDYEAHIPDGYDPTLCKRCNRIGAQIPTSGGLDVIDSGHRERRPQDRVTTKKLLRGPGEPSALTVTALAVFTVVALGGYGAYQIGALTPPSGTPAPAHQQAVTIAVEERR